MIIKIPYRFLFICFLLGAVSLGAVGCDDQDKKTDQAAKTKKKPVASMPDQSGDVAFIAFMGRLKKAVAAHDMDAVAEVMTPDFGYLIEATPDDPGTGKGVFAYWDKNNIWPELELVINERFVPYGDYMVAPPEFAVQEAEYHGYRAGIQLVNGGWKFAYFVKG